MKNPCVNCSEVKKKRPRCKSLKCPMYFEHLEEDKKIDKYLLPYDKRAYEEFNKYLSLIENSLVDNSVKKR